MESRSEFREEMEKNKLSYFIALRYDKDRKRLSLDKKITLTPLPGLTMDPDDPAADSTVLVVDYDQNSEAMAQFGNYLVPDSPLNFSGRNDESK